jgi:hypothetical protein
VVEDPTAVADVDADNIREGCRGADGGRQAAFGRLELAAVTGKRRGRETG